MSVVKFNIPGSNDDIESIIQGYINDLKLKDKYDTVMNELDMVMHDKPRCVFIKYRERPRIIPSHIHIPPCAIFCCKRDNVYFASMRIRNVECPRCMVNLLRDGELYSG